MSSEDEKIRITIVLDRELYREFHAKVVDACATHNGIVRKLIESWIALPAVDPTQPPIKPSRR